MKKILLILLLTARCLHAQEEAPPPEETAPVSSEVPNAIFESTTVAKNSSDWQNWVFAGSAAVVFTVAVLVVTLNTGESQH
ncbi:MAG: hypothetical protein HY069_03930 [Chlamydiia bacterium]|nr:hypothetical protein [Chlamydiia bacterium]